MHIASKLAFVAASVAAAGLMSAPAQGAAAHCTMTEDSVKVETSGSVTVATGLAPGTEVCYKAGTQLGTATVDANGNITSTVKNLRNSNATLGVSYFVYTPGYVEPPCDPEIEYCGS